MVFLHALRVNLEQVFKLPAPAVDWLLMLFQAIQVFDDFADGDKVDRAELDACLWGVLVGMPQNPFWQANAQHLIPIVATQVLKWQASDRAERAGNQDAVSFVWRAGYYDVVLLVVQLCHGTAKATELSPLVMSLYGEKLADYVKEFEHA
jgi:hypothetical protein